jgi:hypothetical protein
MAKVVNFRLYLTRIKILFKKGLYIGFCLGVGTSRKWEVKEEGVGRG